MPENPEGTGQQANVSDELAAARAELEAEKKKHAMVAGLAKNEQEKARRLEAQLREAQTRREVVASRGGIEDGESETIVRMKLQLAQQQEQTDLLRFKVEHPDADMTELQTIYTDPMLRESIVITNSDGNPNVYVTLKNAHRELRARKADEMLSASQAAKAAQTEEQNRQRNAATISGGGGSAPQETIDIANLTWEQMLEKGLVEMDPKDPIRVPQPIRRTGP